MRPCKEMKKQQMWVMDIFGQLRLKENNLLCLRWFANKELKLSPFCRSDFYSYFLKEAIYKYNFDFATSGDHVFPDNENDNEVHLKQIYVVEDGKRQYLGVNRRKQYGTMRLFGPNNTNISLDKWGLKWIIHESQEPSTKPSSTPTLSYVPSLSPTSFPSLIPSTIPSHSPTLRPSPSPTSSQMPTDMPSLIPSDEPSLLPSSIPSDQPSILPSDKVCCILCLVHHCYFLI